MSQKRERALAELKEACGKLPKGQGRFPEGAGRVLYDGAPDGAGMFAFIADHFDAVGDDAVPEPGEISPGWVESFEDEYIRMAEDEFWCLMEAAPAPAGSAAVASPPIGGKAVFAAADGNLSGIASALLDRDPHMRCWEGPDGGLFADFPGSGEGPFRLDVMAPDGTVLPAFGGK